MYCRRGRGGIFRVKTAIRKIKGDTIVYVIAIVGAGGKTSQIKNLTKEYVQQDKKVLVTTTTHMGLEPGMVLSEKPDDIRQQLEKQNFCICGSPVKEEKIASLPKDIYEQVCQLADIVLVEADGSKHMPIKFPAAHEPVIPENVNEIQVVMGLHAIGHPFCEVSHRLELVKQCLNVSDTDLVTEVHLKKLYLEGYQKPLQKKYPKAKIGFFPADHSNYFDN